MKKGLNRIVVYRFRLAGFRFATENASLKGHKRTRRKLEVCQAKSSAIKPTRWLLFHGRLIALSVQSFVLLVTFCEASFRHPPITYGAIGEIAQWHLSCIFGEMMKIAARLILSALIGLVFLTLSSAVFAKSRRTKSPTAKPTATPSSDAVKSDESKPNDDWKVITIGNRDYLTADNVAKFYGLSGAVDATGKTVLLTNGRNQLQLTAETREAFINGLRNWLCFPVLLRDDKLLVSRVDLAKTIEPQLRPHMLPRNATLKTVVIDAGHGGFDKGAVSSYGNEKTFALDVARRLRPLLQAKGFKVILTRENDVFLPLELRARIANATRDSIFVSIHFNATSNTAASGFEIFSLTPRGAPSTADDALALHFVNMQEGSPVDAQSFELSATVYHSMIGHFPEFDRGIKRARFAVLRHTKIPAILVEGGFLSQTTDSKLIANPTWRAKFAESIVTGIESYRNATERKEKPMLAADYRAQEASKITVLDLAQPPARLDAPASFGVIAVAPDADPNKEP